MSSEYFCDIAALTPNERERHAMLAAQLAKSAVSRKELTDGYAFAIDPERISLPEVREWIALERRCCPFFRLSLAMGTGWTLTIQGGAEVKPFIRDELPQFFRSDPGTAGTAAKT